MTVSTKKEVVTRLAERLVGECQVSDLPKYVGEWEPLYEDLRKQFESAYRVFELEFDHEIGGLIEEVRQARDGMQSAEADFRKECDLQTQALESKIERAALDRRRELVEKGSDAKRLKAELPNLLQKLKRERVALTGAEDVSVPEWPGLASKILFWSALTVFMGIEYLVGFELFDWISNSNTALGLSAIVVVGFTAGTYFAVHRFRRINGHREALLRFGQRYPRGHPDGFSVELLPSVERHVAYMLGTLLASFAVVVLAGRTWIASTSDLGLGGVASAIGLLFCFIGYGALEYYLAHPNSKEQVNHLRRAERRVEEHETALREALDSGPDERRYREATDQAIAEYNDAIDAADKRYSDVTPVEGRRRELFDALFGYQLAWETFRSGLSDRCGQLMERVSVRFSLRSGDIALPKDDIIEAFGRSVQRQYDNPTWLEEFKRPFSRVPLERPRIDMDKLKSQIEVSVSITPKPADPSRLLETPAAARLTPIQTKGASG